MTITDEEIKRIAEEAVNKNFDFETPPNPEETKCEVTYETKAFLNDKGIKKPYYYERFYALDDEAKHALNKAYRIRKEPFTDPRWKDLYLEFSKGTKRKHHTGKASDLDDFRTMAVYYCEKYQRGKSTLRTSIETKSDSFYEAKIDEKIQHFRNRHAGLDLC